MTLPLPPVLPSTPTALAGALTAVVVKPPPALAQQGTGTRLEGVVAGTDANGTLEVRLGDGTALALRTGLKAAEGTRVRMEVVRLTPQINVRLVTLPAAQTAPSSPGTGPATPAAAPHATTVPGGTPAAVQGTAPSQTASVAPEIGRPGTSVPGATPAPSPANPTTMANPRPPAPTWTAGAPATPAADASGAVPGAPGRNALPALQADSTVDLPLKDGFTTVAGRVLAPLPGLNTTVAAAAPHPWTALAQALRLVQAGRPDLLSALAETVLPRADADAGTRLLTFLLAARQDSLPAWLGDEAMATIRAARPRLAQRLRSDTTDPGRSEKPARPDGPFAWIPFFADDDLDFLALRIPAPDDGTPQRTPSDGRGASFAVDLDLSRLGRVRLDARIIESEARMDLAIISADALPDTLRERAAALFAEALADLHWQGGVTFRVDATVLRDLPWLPLAEPDVNLSI